MADKKSPEELRAEAVEKARQNREEAVTKLLQGRADASETALSKRNVNLDALKTLETGDELAPVNKLNCEAALTEYGVAAGEVGKDTLSHAKVNLDSLKGTMEKTTELYEQKCVVKPSLVDKIMPK
jgi:hypothetical protein